MTTLANIEAEIADLTTKLHSDRRPTRDEEKKPLADTSIRDERRAWKDRRRALRHQRTAILRAAEAEKPPREVTVIDAELTSLEVERRRIGDQMRALQRERDRSLAVAEVAAMPESKKAALIAALGVASSGSVGTPKATSK